jgi:hypothetical protein
MMNLPLKIAWISNNLIVPERKAFSNLSIPFAESIHSLRKTVSEAFFVSFKFRQACPLNAKVTCTVE